MAFPTVQNTNTSTSAASTSHTVNLPASISSGDLLIVFFGTREKPTITTPSGWTLLKNKSNAAENHQFSIFYKVASGSEGSTVTITTSASWSGMHASYRITGYSGTPEVSTADSGNITQPDPDSLTPAGGAKDYLWIVTAVSVAFSAIGFPTNYSNNNLQVRETITHSRLAVGTRSLNTTVQDPVEYTLYDGGYWEACTIAIPPIAESVVFPPEKRFTQAVNRASTY